MKTHTSYVSSAANVQAMCKAMRLAGMPVKNEGGHFVLRLKSGADLFRAMRGSNGTFLVRHPADLFA